MAEVFVLKLRKPPRRLLGISLTFLLAAMVVLGCSREEGSKASTATAQEIHIGLISPFTGDGAVYGKVAKQGAELALSDVNAAGGIKGKKLSIIYEDDKGTARDAVSAFKKLSSVDSVPAIVGPFYSSNVLACIPAAEQSRVVMISGSATTDNMSGAGKFVFRTCPTNLVQADTAAEYCLKTLHLNKAYVLYRNVDYGLTLKSAFRKAFTAGGGQIIGEDAVAPDTSDVRSQLAKLKAANAKLVFAAVHYKEGAAVLRQMKELGISAQVIGTDGAYDPQLLKIAGDSANGSYWLTIGWGTSSKIVTDFKADFKKRYGEEPGAYAGLYYDAVRVLAESMKKAGGAPDGPSVQRALEGTEFQGATGLTKFNTKHDVSKPFAVYLVKRGQFVPVEEK